jgi:heat shock protein HslJ
MTYENACLKILSGDSTVTLENGTLVLTSSRGVLRFTR